MGDPRKIRKKFETPSHPWIQSRIEDERRLKKEFGTRSKKEIWRAEYLLKKFKTQAKKLILLRTQQATLETELLFKKIKDLGLVEGEVDFDAILGLKVDDILGRRLQSIVYKKGLARSVTQARQFITHEHILVDGKIITSPGYFVTTSQEASVAFATTSSLFSEDHPERASKQRLAELQEAKEKAKKETAKKEAAQLAQEDKQKDAGEQQSEEPKEKEETSDEQETSKEAEPKKGGAQE